MKKYLTKNIFGRHASISEAHSNDTRCFLITVNVIALIYSQMTVYYYRICSPVRRLL